MHLITFLARSTIILVAILLLAACAPQPTATAAAPTTAAATSTSLPTEVDLESIFDLSNKLSGTQLYFSDSLGVGFTYASWPEGPVVSVTESGSVISVTDQSSQTIEVFTKDPALSLQQAIEQRFLLGYDPADCYVLLFDPGELSAGSEVADFLALGYSAAAISFPHIEDGDQPWWANAEKCPANYTEGNGIAYFLMNPEVPGKFIYVRIGQYSAASDGTPLDAQGSGHNWSHSIQILK